MYTVKQMCGHANMINVGSSVSDSTTKTWPKYVDKLES